MPQHIKCQLRVFAEKGRIRWQDAASSLFIVAVSFFLSSQAEATPLFTPIAQSNTVSLTNSITQCTGSPTGGCGTEETLTPFTSSVSSTQIGNFNQAYQNTFNLPIVNGFDPQTTISTSSFQSFSMNDSSISVLFGNSFSYSIGSGNPLGGSPFAYDIDTAQSSFDIQFTVTQATQLTVNAQILDPNTRGVSATVPGIGLVSRDGAGGFTIQELNNGTLLVTTLDPGTYDFTGSSNMYVSSQQFDTQGLGGTGNFTLSFAPVPESSTALLLAAGIAGLALRRRHARSASLGERRELHSKSRS